MHSGHIFLLLLPPCSLRRHGFGGLLHALVDLLPSADYAFAMVFEDQTKAAVVELDQRAVFVFAQPVLHIVRNWIRHEEWSRDLQQLRAIDRLHRAPEVSIAIVEITEPAS